MGQKAFFWNLFFDGLAEYYSADLAQKVKRGMTENVLEGKFNGGLVPYGYKVVDQKYQIDENEAQLIKEIFNLYANTEISANKISKYLTSKGIFNRNGNPFNNGTIYGILGCRKYIGEYSIGNHVNKNGIPAIIDEDTFNRAFQKRATFKKHSSSFRSKVGYALAGKAYCGICGNILIGESSTKRDQTYNYYRCSNYRKKKCEVPAVKSVLLDKIVVESTIRFLQDTISDDEMAKTLLEQRFGKTSSSTILQNKILEIEKKMDNIISTIESGQGFDGLKKRYEELQDQRITLEAECIKEKEKEKAATISKDELQAAFSVLSRKESMEKVNKRRVIIQSIDSVFVFPDGRVTIFFQFKGSKHVSLEGIKNGLSIEKVKNNFYMEKIFGDGYYGISVKDPSFRFADKRRYKMKCIYKNSTNQYYKFPDTVFDSLDGLELVTAIKDQMSKKPRIFKRPFTIEEIAN